MSDEGDLNTLSSREVGARMRRHRERTGLTVEALAASVRATPEDLTRWEAGEGMAPFPTLMAITAQLGITMNDLLG